MTDSTGPHPQHNGGFETAVRGYSRHQVDEYAAAAARHAAGLEDRLSRALAETERLRAGLAAAQQAAAGKPPHEEVSERIAQILKLAAEEARAQKTRAEQDINALRAQTRADADALRAQAKTQAEQVLATAHQQAQQAIAAAQAEAEAATRAAHAEASQLTTQARQHAETTRADADARARTILDEATARAAAIHDGAEQRLGWLTSRHTETLRRLTDIRDSVTELVAQDAARGSLEAEVAATAAATPQPSPAHQLPNGHRTSDQPAGQPADPEPRP